MPNFEDFKQILVQDGLQPMRKVFRLFWKIENNF